MQTNYEQGQIDLREGSQLAFMGKNITKRYGIAPMPSETLLRNWLTNESQRRLTDRIDPVLNISHFEFKDKFRALPPFQMVRSGPHYVLAKCPRGPDGCVPIQTPVQLPTNVAQWRKDHAEKSLELEQRTERSANDLDASI